MGVFLAAALSSAPALAGGEDVPAPPRCDDSRVLADLRAAYVQVAGVLELKPLAGIRSPRQTLLTAHPLRTKGIVVNAPAWGPARFCTAALDLEGGARDTAYYRIEAQVGAAEDQFAFTPCFAAEASQLSRQESEPVTCRALQRP